jgi:hypothetical protein
VPPSAFTSTCWISKGGSYSDRYRKRHRSTEFGALIDFRFASPLRFPINPFWIVLAAVENATWVTYGGQTKFITHMNKNWRLMNWNLTIDSQKWAR